MIAGGLDNKNVTTANGFLKRDGTFTVSKLRNSSAAEIHKEIAANIFSKIRIGITGKDFKLLRMRCHYFLFLRHEDRIKLL
jgi:hypothetical protein